MRISVNSTFVKYFTREYVSRLPKLMRVTYGWCCVYDIVCVGGTKVSEKCDSIKLVNRYNVLQHEDSTEHGRAFERVGMTPIRDVGQGRKPVAKIKHGVKNWYVEFSGIM